MEQEKIDLIAEKVMGWKKDNYCVGVDVYKRPGISSLSVSEYNPFTNLAQAVEALKQYCHDNNVYWCLGWTSPYDEAACSIQNKDGSMIVQAKHIKDSEAISLALIEAIGEKG